ncbi:MAG: hypothetical protein ACKO96_39960, partial [Flammeovirgaceae bacterium]
MIFIFVYGKMELMFLFSAVWSQKEVSILRVAGVPVELEFVSLENQTEQLIFGISWINLISGLCN